MAVASPESEPCRVPRVPVLLGIPSREPLYDRHMPGPKDIIFTIAADGVGAVSAALGGILALAPLTGGPWLGLTDTEVQTRRIFGVADLGLGLAIIAGRSSHWRWQVVGARAVLHLLFAREYMQSGRRQHSIAMCSLFALDAGVAVGLRRAHQSA